MTARGGCNLASGMRHPTAQPGCCLQTAMATNETTIGPVGGQRIRLDCLNVQVYSSANAPHDTNVSTGGGAGPDDKKTHAKMHAKP